MYLHLHVDDKRRKADFEEQQTRSVDRSKSQRGTFSARTEFFSLPVSNQQARFERYTLSTTEQATPRTGTVLTRKSTRLGHSHPLLIRFTRPDIALHPAAVFCALPLQ